MRLSLLTHLEGEARSHVSLLELDPRLLNRLANDSKNEPRSRGSMSLLPCVFDHPQG